MRDGYEIGAELDVVCQMLDYWHYGEQTAENRAELKATKAELVKEAEERIKWVLENIPEDDIIRELEQELIELQAQLDTLDKVTT